jgi:hypothetical protein
LRTDVLARRADPHALLKIAALLPADFIWRNERVLSSWAALLKCFAYALLSSNVR